MGNGVSRLLSLLIFAILARQLSVNELGLYSLLITIMMFASEVMSPFDSYFVSQLSGKEYIRNNINIFFKTKVVYSAALLLTGLLLSYLIAKYFLKDTGNTRYVYLFLISGGFMTILTCYGSMHQANEDFLAFSLVNTLYNLGIFVALICIWSLKLKVNMLLLSMVYLSVMSLFAALYSVKICKTSHKVSSYSEAISKFVTLKSLLAASFIRLLSNRIDLFLIANLLTVTEIAKYSVATRVPSVSMLFVGNIMSITVSRAPSALKSKDNLNQYLAATAKLYLALAIIVSAVIVFSPFIIRLIAGGQYTDCYKIADILILQTLVTGLVSPFTSLLYSMNLTGEIFRLEMLRLVYSSLSIVILLYWYGLTGAASGLLLSSLLNMLLTLEAVRNNIKNLPESSP